MVLLLWHLLTLELYAQEPTGIAVLARPSKDSILLRWAPTDAQSWRLLNKYGYHITRFTVLEDGKLLGQPQATILTPRPILPQPLEAWQALSAKNDQHAMIAAQALYGAEFKVSHAPGKEIASVVNNHRENESRFSFALFSADQSFEVAKLMGLAFVDNTAKSNQNYIYRIYPARTTPEAKVDTGFVYTGFSSYSAPPKPVDLQAEALEKGVMLSWDQTTLMGVYTTYWVERSEDGGNNFTRISDAPVVNTATGEQSRVTKMDTVSAFHKRLMYRVKGVTPFGELGPSSDTVVIQASPVLSSVPSITRFEVVGDSVMLEWTLPPGSAKVSGFDIERSQHIKDGFMRINSAQILPAIDRFVDVKPFSSGYYRVRAIGQNGSTVSFPVFVQLPDSIPPSPPIGLSGTIGKAGIVHLQWARNKEKDIYGYRVFRANHLEEDFVQVTRAPLTSETFADTLEVQTLSRKIFYRVVALDRHYNPSDFSQPLELKRPDVIPPAPPSFTRVVAQTGGIRLSWHGSSSEDIANHALYRTEDGKESWVRLKIFSDTTSTYFDPAAEKGIRYAYKVRATDQSGLESDSKPFSAQAIDPGLRPVINAFKAIPDREKLQITLQWKYDQPRIKSFLLYRKEGGKPIRLYKTLDEKQLGFYDKALFINTDYQYRLKAIFQDGTETALSKPVLVKY